jgi:hypothetical protein
MAAPQKFADWLDKHTHHDPQYGYIYKYHPRSDAHSIALCKFVLEDLLEKCGVLSDQAARRVIAYGINVRHIWPNKKRKTIDLAIGKPEQVSRKINIIPGVQRAESFTGVFVSCEAKTVMTEHGKSEPRLFDELGSSHEIVHQGSADAIAAGITVINISDTFVSPLRQTQAETPHVSRHRQPDVAKAMVEHLRGLQIRERIGEVGFDAYCSVLVDTDNVSYVRLWTAPPAPQPGERDHYDTFVQRIVAFYEQRFSVLS